MCILFICGRDFWGAGGGCGIINTRLLYRFCVVLNILAAEVQTGVSADLA